MGASAPKRARAAAASATGLASALRPRVAASCSGSSRKPRKSASESAVRRTLEPPRSAQASEMRAAKPCATWTAGPVSASVTRSSGVERGSVERRERVDTLPHAPGPGCGLAMAHAGEDAARAAGGQGQDAMLDARVDLEDERGAGLGVMHAEQGWTAFGAQLEVAADVGARCRG